MAPIAITYTHTHLDLPPLPSPPPAHLSHPQELCDGMGLQARGGRGEHSPPGPNGEFDISNKVPPHAGKKKKKGHTVCS